MLGSIDVTMGRGQRPSFPDCCCACLTPAPARRLRLSRRQFRLVDLLTFWLLLARKPERFEVPICSGCLARHRRQRAFRGLVLCAVVAVAIVLLDRLDLPRPARKLALLAAVGVLGLPLWLWFASSPPAFDVTVGDAHVDYEFGNPDYAARFLAANDGAWSDDVEDGAEGDLPGDGAEDRSGQR